MHPPDVPGLSNPDHSAADDRPPTSFGLHDTKEMILPHRLHRRRVGMHHGRTVPSLTRIVALRLAFCFALVLLFASLGALVDLALHPKTPCFDNEHLVAVAITAAVVVVHLGLLEVFLARQRRDTAALKESKPRHRE